MNLKRSFDIAAALICAIPATPLVLGLAFASAVIHRQSGFFSQQRVGRNGEIFTIYKVKSMRDEFNDKGEALPDEKRLNLFGRLLRASHMDELPQLYNILKGDMSFVGPRPLTPSHHARVAFDEVRCQVRPGYTGLAQINGHDKLPDEARLKLDQEYVAGHNGRSQLRNFMSDLKIILKTPLAPFKHGL